MKHRSQECRSREESELLPLSQTLLVRNASHLSALGLSLHMRDAPNKPTPCI